MKEDRNQDSLRMLQVTCLLVPFSKCSQGAIDPNGSSSVLVAAGLEKRPYLECETGNDWEHMVTRNNRKECDKALKTGQGDNGALLIFQSSYKSIYGSSGVVFDVFRRAVVQACNRLQGEASCQWAWV